ncbi:SGNH hydrolase-type esterase domain-containing protein [Xylariaceae sp. FL1651]|nr:SGNH hydrolase-type esterase domain-containing protein [Xylariaceae sp. FL1651]
MGIFHVQMSFALYLSFATLAQSALKVSSITRGAPLRVLPLGDSITFGYNELSGNSYRRDLECFLYVGGNPVSMIGSVQNGDWGNNQSDAFNLHTIDEIREAGTPELTQKVNRPNVILLHAGTVNFVVGTNVTNAAERLGSLIDFITLHNPATLLVVSQLITNANTTVNALVNRYNTQLPAVVAQRARAGEKVVLTSMDDVKVGDLPDGTHPNEVGYHKMAVSWFNAISEAGVRGLITPAEGSFMDAGSFSLSPSGDCEDLTD